MGIALEEAVEEALCFGWIDSKLHVADKTSYKLWFSPRKKGSTWSKSNKQRIEKLTQLKLMTAAGLKAIETAKQDGSWNKLDPIEELQMPEDFQRVLMNDVNAQSNFDAFSKSQKKLILWWIQTAKTNKTRQNRIQKATALAAQNKTPN